MPVPSMTTNTRFGSAARHALLIVVSKVAPCLGRVPYLVTSARRAPPGLFLFRAGGARSLGGVTLEMYNDFHHQAPVTERPVAL